MQNYDLKKLKWSIIPMYDLTGFLHQNEAEFEKDQLQKRLFNTGVFYRTRY